MATLLRPHARGSPRLLATGDRRGRTARRDGRRPILAWLRTLILLRHPEFRELLGELRLRHRRHAEIRRRHPAAKLSAGIEWVGYEPSRLELGEAAVVEHGTVLAFGDERNGFGRIAIGAGTWIGQYNNLRASGDADIVVGEGCLVSQFCSLVGSNHSIARSSPIATQGPDRSRLGVVLEPDVWLGAGVAVTAGVRVGRGAVVGANAVVTQDVPAHEIWAGVPARKIGERR
jgi:acetyltransferase-like isoleucine patch superfamily enzyme